MVLISAKILSQDFGKMDRAELEEVAWKLKLQNQELRKGLKSIYNEVAKVKYFAFRDTNDQL